MFLLNTEHLAKTRTSLKRFSAVFLVVVSLVLVDVILSSLVDINLDFSTSQAGMSLFILETGIIAAGTYFLLKSATDKIRGRYRNGVYENKLVKGVWAFYYLIDGILIFVILQILLFSEYYTGLLSITSIISYGFASILMGLLAYRFFSWFVRNKSLLVLLYGAASILASVYVILLSVIFYVGIFIYQSPITTPESIVSFPEIMPGFEQILIVVLPQILTAATFLSFWGGTIAILYANIRRVGRTRFWILVTTPIVFFLGTLISLFPEIQGAAPTNDPNSIVVPMIITTFSQVAAIGLFATAFVSMARAIPHHQISDYMYITCYGLLLFSIGIIATISGAGYPPFGLPTVSFVGIFSFLLFTGLNHSAISTAEDSKLRRSIQVYAKRELKLLDNIGRAELEERLEKKVLAATKLGAENTVKHTGIEPTLTMQEARQYLNEILDEVRDRKNESK